MGSRGTLREEETTCECRGNSSELCLTCREWVNNWERGIAIGKVKNGGLTERTSNSDKSIGLPLVSFPRVPCTSSSSSFNGEADLNPSIPSCSTHPLPTNSVVLSLRGDNGSPLLSGSGFSRSFLPVDVGGLSPGNPFIPLLSPNSITTSSKSITRDKWSSNNFSNSGGFVVTQEDSISTITLRPSDSTASIPQKDIPPGHPSNKTEVAASSSSLTNRDNNSSTSLSLDSSSSLSSLEPVATTSLDRSTLSKSLSVDSQLQSGSRLAKYSNISLHPCPAKFHLARPQSEPTSFYPSSSKNSYFYVSSTPDLHFPMFKAPQFRSASSVQQEPVSILRQSRAPRCRNQSLPNSGHRVTFSASCNEMYLDALEDNSDIEESNSSQRLGRNFGF